MRYIPNAINRACLRWPPRPSSIWFTRPFIFRITESICPSVWTRTTLKTLQNKMWVSMAPWDKLIVGRPIMFNQELLPPQRVATMVVDLFHLLQRTTRNSQWLSTLQLYWFPWREELTMVNTLPRFAPGERRSFRTCPCPFLSRSQVRRVVAPRFFQRVVREKLSSSGPWLVWLMAPWGNFEFWKKSKVDKCMAGFKKAVHLDGLWWFYKAFV